MDAKPLPAILVAVLLACLAFSAKCEGGSEERPASGGLRRWLADGERKGDKLSIILCFKRGNVCGHALLRCYCCLTLPGCPCYEEQQECWDVCPVPSAHAATPPSAFGRGGGRGAEGKVVVSTCTMGLGGHI